MKHLVLILLALSLASCVGPDRAAPVPRAAPVRQRVAQAAVSNDAAVRATAELRKVAPAMLQDRLRVVETSLNLTGTELREAQVELDRYESEVRQQSEALSASTARQMRLEKKLNSAEQSRDKAIGLLWKWRAITGALVCTLALGAWLTLRPRL